MTNFLVCDNAGIKGRYCKDCKVFTDNIDQDALSIVYRFLDHPVFEGAKINVQLKLVEETMPKQ